MRLPALLVAVIAFGLSACANMSPGPRPNGWARSVAETSVSQPDEQEQQRRRSTREAEDYVGAEIRRTRVAGREESDEEGSDAEAVSTYSGMVIPVIGVQPEDLSDSFHAPRSGGRTHHAIDISAPRGTPLLAAVDGTITRKHWNRLGGRTLYLTSADGRYDFYYAHLDSYADGIEIGTTVRRGEVLGTVGSTGNAQGPHLHFQVLDKRGSGRGTPVNPYDLLQRAEVASR
ncbi:MAG: M23 family metallopeptidase [Rubricoccaceae bacterium]|nr:M23 family metallopeptidase [Rubricoccaceae bacterium]